MPVYGPDVMKPVSFYDNTDTEFYCTLAAE